MKNNESFFNIKGKLRHCFTNISDLMVFEQYSSSQVFNGLLILFFLVPQLLILYD